MVGSFSSQLFPKQLEQIHLFRWTGRCTVIHDSATSSHEIQQRPVSRASGAVDDKAGCSDRFGHLFPPVVIGVVKSAFSSQIDRSFNLDRG